MKVRIKIFLLLLLFFIGVGVTEARKVSFSVSAPRQVVQGNKFSVEFVLNDAEGTNLQAPDFNDFQIIYGPSVYTSYNHKWVNGKTESSLAQTFTYILLASKAGTYNVPATTIDVDGKRYSTKPFSIEVLPQDKSASNSQQGQNVRVDDAATQSASNQVNSQDLFVRINLSKQKVYEQEAVVCTIKLYSKYNISQFVITQQPSFDGFLIEELPVVQGFNSLEQYDGDNYKVAELKKCILYPQKSGKLSIASGKYDVSVVQYNHIRTMFGVERVPVEKKVIVQSNSASVDVMSLPEPHPASFNGAVGQFSVNTELKPNSFKTYEAAIYNYIVKGTGNVKYLQAPTINFPSQFDVYDPQSIANAKPVGGNMSGSMKFEYTFIPQYVGDYEIPASEFTYFDPKSAEYVTLRVPGHTMKVAKGVASGQHVVAKDLELKNTDILHIKTGDLNLKKDHVMYLSMFIYWLWYIVPILILLAIMWYYRKTIKDRANMQLLKTKRANKVAKKRLKQAKAFMSANDSNQFYAEMLKALWGYLSDKLSIPVSELNKENIISELEMFGASQEVVNEVMAVLDKCEFAQYAPELGESDMGEVYENVSEIMDKLEATKRK